MHKHQEERQEEDVAWFTYPLHPAEQRRHEEEYERLNAPVDLQKEYLTPMDAVLCHLSPMVVFYVMFFLMFVEGILLISPYDKLFQGFDAKNPFREPMEAVCKVFGVIDLITILIGCLGMYMRQNKVLYWFNLREHHSTVASACTGTVCAWRFILCILIAPLLGTALAFQPATFDQTTVMFEALGYIAVNLFLCWALLIVHRVISVASDELQEEIDNEIAQERTQLLADLYASGPGPHYIMQETEMFMCLPLDASVFAYLFAGMVLSLGWYIDKKAFRHTVGGWMAPLGSPSVPITMTIEEYTYLFSSLTLFMGIIGMCFFRAAREEELQARVASPIGYNEKLEYAIKNQRRSLFFMLTSFIAGVFRYALFIPITGMSLLATDVCGLYIHSIASLSLKATTMPGTHCSGKDVSLIFVVITLMAMDAYGLWGFFRLWRHYRCCAMLGENKENLSAYGAMSHDCSGEARFVVSKGSGSINHIKEAIL